MPSLDRLQENREVSGELMTETIEALTEREKETLRLVLRGYDAKSMARHLDLSVHTINERLRCARRKLGVSSSRAAARKLAEVEAHAPQSLVGKKMGEAPTPLARQSAANEKPGKRFGWIVGGLIFMTLIAATFAIFAMSNLAQPTGNNLMESGATQLADEVDPVLLQTAQDWLSLVDEGQWVESWAATGEVFRILNTSETWAALSEQVRAPLGAVRSRSFLESESVPTPPNGAEVIRFRTSFAKLPEATETVSLIREDGQWKVVGYWIG